MGNRGGYCSPDERIEGQVGLIGYMFKRYGIDWVERRHKKCPVPVETGITFSQPMTFEKNHFFFGDNGTVIRCFYSLNNDY